MRRYLFQGDVSKLPQTTCDVVIVGCGLAGLYTALNMDPKLKVVLINKNGLDESNSMYAQGGIAAAMADDDSPALHYEDSCQAGAGKNDPKALQVLVQEGPDNINQLIDWGVPFDRKLNGSLSLGREGAHSRQRIIHSHGDATGLHVTRTLAERLAKADNCEVLHSTCLVDFLSDDQGAVVGILTMSSDTPNNFAAILATHVVLATGGIGGLYPRTTNAAAATADGLSAAIRSGADVEDLEFIQFHPTALPQPDETGRCFLISEAVRGEGAVLRNHRGKAFMANEHPLADLAPRDVVSRAIFRQMLDAGTEHVWLDATMHSQDFLAKRFPTIFSHCMRLGIDMASQWLPVAPVQHYFMGGVKTNTEGQTSLHGLWACGEASWTGVYGANRLASNSLLECLVFGRRIARSISLDPNAYTSRNGVPAKHEPIKIRRRSVEVPAQRIDTIRRQIHQVMDRDCGIVRNQEGLSLAAAEIESLAAELDQATIHTVRTMETCQMVLAAQKIVEAALTNKVSIGAHYRSDDPASKLDSVV